MVDVATIAAMQAKFKVDAAKIGSREDAQFSIEAAVGTIIHATTTPVVVVADAAYLMGLSIRTALVGTLTLAGLTDETGSATSYVIPVGAVGEMLYGADIRFPAGITVTLSSASDADKVIVAFRRVYQSN